MRPVTTLFVLTLLLGCSAGDGVTVFDGPVDGTGDFTRARLVQLPDGSLSANVVLRGDSRTPADVKRSVTRNVAQTVVGRHCSNGEERLSAPPAPDERGLGGTTVEFAERSLWRCMPDPRTPEQIRAARFPVLQERHPCGIHPDDFVVGRPANC